LHINNDQLPSGTKQWLDKRRVEGHFHICHKSKADFQRLARYLTGNAIGLVLGGGGARGFSHIGVVHALKEAGIPIDMIGGTSMGAIISAGYAMGLSYQEVLRLSKKFFQEFKPFRAFTLPIFSLLTSKKLRDGARVVFNNTFIEDLWINYFCVSCNLSSSEMFVHKEGLLCKAVSASGSIPGIVEPIIYNGNLFIDGGVVNNLPSDVMKSFCKGHVIAISASSEKALTTDHDDIMSPWKFLLGKIIPSSRSVNIPNIADIITQTMVVSSLYRSKMSESDTDLYFHPPVDHFGLFDFSKIDDIAEVGRRYMAGKISDVKRDLQLPLEFYT
jgi:NTE family protein/lysophospholipid hydrolase